MERMFGVLFAVLAAPAALFCADLLANENVGRIEGQFSVSNDGDAGYQIPIELPPGIAGIQPQLSIMYTSAGGNDLLGVGWVLSGLGRIERCGANFAQDGINYGVTFSSFDRFCLEGQKLRLASGSYGGDQSEYRNEIENFTQVRAYANGAPGFAPSEGPQYFVARTRDAVILEYGGTEDARVRATAGSRTVVREWLISRVADPQGNEMTFEYIQDEINGTYRPAVIRYTGRQGQSPAYEVRFEYEERPGNDQISKYVFGQRVQLKHRLTQIAVYHQGAPVWDYRLQYQSESETASRRSRLASVTRCAPGGCMEPTTVAYSNGSAGMGPTKDDGVHAELRYNQFFDMNGDGRDDLIYPSGGFWLVRLGQLNGTLGQPINTGMAADNAQYALPMDYNGDGRGDLIYPAGTASTPGNWIVLLSKGTTFERILTNVPLLGSISSQTTVDFNGDGLDDIMGINGNGLYRTYNTPNGLVAGEQISNEASSASDAFLNHQIVPRSIHRRADFNGDGNDDLLIKQVITICFPGGSCSTIVDYQIYLLTATGSYPAANFSYTNYIINGITILDVNGDGLSDIAYTQQTTSNLNSNRLFLKISRGDGTLATIDALPYDESQSIICAVPMDWDGDGRDDIVDAGGGTGFYRVFRSNGEGFDPPFTTNVPVVSSCRISVLDVNGDGRVDIASQHNNRFYIHTHHAGEPDLATRFRDGYGNEHTITYKPLTDPAVYTKGIGATFPDYDFQGPIHAVSQLVSTDGAGGVYSMNYRYGGARIHRRGRGYLGMGSQTVTDSRNGISATSQFSQVFPWIGLATSVTTQQPGGRKISELSTELAQKIFGTGFAARYFPYASSAQAKEYELNGLLTKGVTVTSTYDDHGNVTEMRTGTADGLNNNFETVVSTTYQNNLQTNCLGRWVQRSTTQILPDGRSETRVQEAAQDTVNCRMTSSTDQPGTPLAVTTRYAYDLWGNQTLLEVTGAGMAPRASRRDFGATGQFPVRLVNPLGHVALQSWNEALGVLQSSTDPNGLTVQWQHDGFGRPVREIRPDGSETEWVREWCSLGCGVTAGIYRITTSIRSRLTSATAGSSAVIHDRMDRGVRTLTTLLGGRQSLADVEYDSLGRVKRTTEPYFAGETRFNTVMTYDLLNRVVEENRPVNESQPSGRITRAAYNGLVNVTTSPNGQTTTRHINAIGQTIKVQDHLSGEIYYRYHPFGEMAAVTDAGGNTKTTTYDTRGNPTLVVDPDLGQWRYAYNALGELTSQISPRNQTTSYVYDALGRMTERSEPEGVSKWEYDTGSGKGVGRIAAVTGPDDYAEYYSYDNLGRVSEAITDTGETADGVRTGTNIDNATDFRIPSDPNLGLYVIRNNYDEFSRISKLTYPEVSAIPFAVQYRYDASGALEQVSDATLPSRIFWSAGEVNARGQSVAESWGDGSSIQRTYDAARGHLSSQMAQGRNEPLQALAYDWDAENNLIARRDSRQNLAERFEYDGLNRLTRVYSPNIGLAQSIGYGPTGNIRQRSDVGTYQYKGSQPAAVTAAGSKSFAYDAAGNMQQRQLHTLSWTSYNLPSRIAGTRGEDQFRYGPARNRYWRHERLVLPLEEITGFKLHPKVQPFLAPITDSEYFPRYVRETTYIDIRGLYEKWTRDGVDTHRYLIRVGGRVVAQHSETAGVVQTHYFHRDHLGSLDVITDALGNVVARLSYDAWGQARNAQTWSGPPAQGGLNAVLDITRAGYTGHEMLWASGTVHMNGRVYDPGTGRMISADPTIPRMWDAQTHNRYAYVYNNPLSLVDPTGFSGEEPTPGATPLDSVEVTGQRIYTNPFNFRFALTTPWESQPTVDPHGFLLNQLANSAEEEAAAAEQAIYQNPGSRLNKLRQQRADRAKNKIQAYKGAVIKAFSDARLYSECANNSSCSLYDPGRAGKTIGYVIRYENGEYIQSPTIPNQYIPEGYEFVGNSWIGGLGPITEAAAIVGVTPPWVNESSLLQQASFYISISFNVSAPVIMGTHRSHNLWVFEPNKNPYIFE